MLGLGGFRPTREDCGLHLGAENEQNRIGVKYASVSTMPPRLPCVTLKSFKLLW
jgi:hypothetical protein